MKVAIITILALAATVAASPMEQTERSKPAGYCCPLYCKGNKNAQVVNMAVVVSSVNVVLPLTLVEREELWQS